MINETRPWGCFEVLVDHPHYKIKKITILSGKRLSLQSHQKRSEHWFVLKGNAKVTLNDKEHYLSEGDSIDIPFQMKHRVENCSIEDLELIEIQTGSYFGEDDIVRYSDDFGRSK